ncbi:FAD:protein FMN transferase [Demequina sp. NBRC 110052]|uniref:FAD:protein FMN transferase n=1 Tax=Demequina sp. NBRC 110052 TaxID=1570341 RepID=UPI000A01BFC6|nr:FAD:protein FMN transferase [Demequina sp. NBRC 110052]
MILTARAMAMEFTLDVELATGDPDDALLARTMAHVEHDLRWIDEVFSTFKAGSHVSRLNRGEISPDDAPPAVAQVLELCEKYREETGGAFDAVAPDGTLDPTGIVKTWAIDRVRWRLDALPARGWLWGCGGDAMVSGLGPDAGPWRVGIAHPEDRSRHVGAVELGRGRTAIATSGTTIHAQHIWDPAAGDSASSTRYVQATVIGTDLIECDAWATAIVARGESAALAAQERGLDVLALRVEGGRVVAERSPGWAWAA